MPDPATEVRLVVTTASSVEEARNLANVFVEERLAACVTLVPSVESIYRWKGAVESAAETLLVVKTSVERIAALEARLHALHSYETPEFLVLTVDAASAAYLQWVKGNVGDGA